MNNKLRFPLILGWLLIPYGIGYYVSLNGINLGALEIYTEVFRRWALLLCLLLFLGCIWLSKDQSSEGDVIHVAGQSLWIGWLVGLLLSFGIVLSLFIYVDPHGRFAGNRFPSITPVARAIKTQLYKNLDIAPDIIIMGSSRAFTLSPEYIEKHTSYKTFNMSVDKGRVDDYDIQLKYILNQQDGSPYSLVIEFSQDSLPKENRFDPNLQPISLISYLPFNRATLVVEAEVRDTFGLQGLSDSVYLLTLPDVKTMERKTRFERDGLGIIKPVDAKEYTAKMKESNLEKQFNTMYCDGLPNQISKRRFKDMLAIALENNIGIVLYESPINGAFYNIAYNANPDRFKQCRQILRNYLGSLATTYPNVFFRDLSGYEAINSLEENGFYDTIHLKPIAADMVIDALLPDIKSAIIWARENRQKTTSP